MLIHADRIRNGSHARPGIIIEWIRTQLRRVPVFPRIVLGVYLGLLASTLLIISAARVEKLNHIVEPPPETLPGNLVPSNIPCDSTTYSQRFQCRFSDDYEMGQI